MTKTKVYIHAAAPRHHDSHDFYKKMGFVNRFSNESITVFSDSQMDIIIRHHASARHGFTVYADDLDPLLASIPFAKFELDGGVLIADPNGVKCWLYNANDHPELLADKPENKNRMGTCYGAGIESVHFDASIAFYAYLGYKPTSVVTDQSQYITLSREDGIDITLYKPGICPHAFYNPSLTYFNGKEGNKRVIEDLRKSGITFREEITLFNEEGLVDNIIVSDPAAFHSFIFNDG